MIKYISLKVQFGIIKVMKAVPTIVPDKKGSLHIFCLTLLICRHYLGGPNPTPLPPCSKHNTSKRSSLETVFQIFRTGGRRQSFCPQLRRSEVINHLPLNHCHLRPSHKRPHADSAQHSISSSTSSFSFVGTLSSTLLSPWSMLLFS